MKTRKANNEVIGVENIGAYVIGKKELHNRHFAILPDGSQYYIINGKYIPAELSDEPAPKMNKKGR